MKRFALALMAVAVLLAACGGADGNYFAPTAALICTELSCTKIPESDVSDQLAMVLRNPQAIQAIQGPKGAQNRLDAQREILGSLIIDQVVLQQARVQGIRASDAEVNKLLAQLRSGYKTEAKFQAQMRKEGLTLDQIKTYLKGRAVENKIVESVGKDSTPSDQDVANFYDLNKSQFDEQVRASHILICAGFDATKRTCTPGSEDQTLAAGVVGRARKGEDFGALAKEFSQDSATKDKAGDLGFFARGDLDQAWPGLGEAAFNLVPGGISEPVKTSLGYEIVKLTAIGRPFDDAKADIAELLRRQQIARAYQSWLVDAVKKSRIKVNPKFGMYDKISQNVVPLKSQAPSGSPAP
jgi:foldase protein PrsA